VSDVNLMVEAARETTEAREGALREQINASLSTIRAYARDMEVGWAVTGCSELKSYSQLVLEGLQALAWLGAITCLAATQFGTWEGFGRRNAIWKAKVI